MKNTKYRFMRSSSVTPVDRPLRRSVQRSEQRLSFSKQPVSSTGNSLFTIHHSPFNIHNSSFIIYNFFLLLFLSSCQKVINVKLNEGDKKIVIEGIISNAPDSLTEVRVSQTKAFEESNAFNGVSGAVVTIGVNDTAYRLHEDSTGVYHTRSCKGIPGSTYKLSVTVSGTTFTATSSMPARAVTLDSLTVENLGFGGSNANLTIFPRYQDPPGSGNSYRLVEYKNGGQVKYIFEQNDDLSDGLVITRPLVNPDGDIQIGDTVKVELQCIDANVYKYWFSLDESATGNNQSATPTNPVTNIEGGALGYFSAYTISSYTIVVP